MSTLNAKQQLIGVDEIELDTENPRIAHFLEQFPEPHTPEMIFLALGAGGEEDGGAGPSFNRLKQSILTNRGIINPVILRKKENGGYFCVEGNTRVALYREFAKSQLDGEWDKIPALVYDNIGDAEAHAIRLQAHLVGPRQWSPYAKAKYLNYLRNEQHFPFSQLVDFCGGNQRQIVESLEAYADMENYYRPLLESDADFDPQRFSGFVELQKPGVKAAITKAGFTISDFAQWIIAKKISKLERVRRLPQVLRDPKARDVFLKKGIEEAIRVIDLPDTSKALQEANISALSRALVQAINRVEYKEIRQIKEDPTGAVVQYLEEAREAIDTFLNDVGTDS